LKKILILHPHFPPSNLASVHRPRLFTQHLPSFGWEPTMLVVHEDFYEEKLDWNLHKLLSPQLKIVKVAASAVGKKRFIGDIGLRAFFQLYRKAKWLIKNEGFDFLYIPIPSFYCALLGRLLNRSTNIKYGIDYIDPWVHFFPGSEKLYSRHWFSTKLAKILEPIAVKKASLITGVAEGYYLPVIERNNLQSKVVHGAMPYGGEEQDHASIKHLNTKPYLFQKKDKLVLVYAGAMLPKAYVALEQIFMSISIASQNFSQIEFHFIGTGSKATDNNSFNVKPLAEKYGLWQNIVFEYPARIPYLDVLVHLNAADAVFVLGSTEPHYTPSKVYQAVLSKKPVYAVLHSQSTASNILKSSNAGTVTNITEDTVHDLSNQFLADFNSFLNFVKSFSEQKVNYSLFNQFSAFAVTEQLATLLNQAIKK
jgi:hypothetical protein